jgi:hypothetical protein
MTCPDPKKRPTATQVVQAYAKLRVGIPPKDLGLKLAPRDSGPYVSALFTFHGIVNQGIFALQRVLRLLHPSR